MTDIVIEKTISNHYQKFATIDVIKANGVWLQ